MSLVNNFKLKVKGEVNCSMRLHLVCVRVGDE